MSRGTRYESEISNKERSDSSSPLSVNGYRNPSLKWIGFGLASPATLVNLTLVIQADLECAAPAINFAGAAIRSLAYSLPSPLTGRKAMLLQSRVCLHKLRSVGCCPKCKCPYRPRSERRW